MNKIKQIGSKVRGSFWFLPTLIVASSIALALGLIEADSSGSREWMENWPRLFGASAAGSREMLSTIAGSMMTVVGVTFSMTLMTLALASSQYTSRILRNFMRDRVTQIVLGIFAGVFTYSLIVLRTIRGGEEGEFIPSLSVAVSMVLAIGGIGALIYFIHHIAASIQASSIIASVAAETLVVVNRLFPEKPGHGPGNDDEDQSTPAIPEPVWQNVAAPKDGYIQSVDGDALVRLARKHETVVRMERGIGEFVVKESTLASVSLPVQPDKKLVAAVQSAYSIGRYRTVEQDAGFGIRQIVDMALRALSPSSNDTTSAVMCVDYLAAILSRLTVRDIPSSHRYEKSKLRMIALGPTFAVLVAESFDQIRCSADDNAVLLIRLLDALETIDRFTTCESRRQVLREQMQYNAEVADRTIKSPQARTRFENRLAQVRRGFEAAPPSTQDRTEKPS